MWVSLVTERLGIEVCLQVPPNVADRAKIEMAAKTASKVRKSILSAASQVRALEEGELRAKRMQGTPPHLRNKDAKRIKVGSLLSDLFEGQG
jgi:hypothetical protein